MCNYERMVMRQQRAPNAGNFSEWQRGVCLTFHTPASVFIRASIKDADKMPLLNNFPLPKREFKWIGEIVLEILLEIHWLYFNFLLNCVKFFTRFHSADIWMYSHAPNGSHSIRFQSAQFRLFKTSHWLTFENKHLISIYKMRQTISK